MKHALELSVPVNARDVLEGLAKKTAFDERGCRNVRTTEAEGAGAVGPDLDSDLGETSRALNVSAIHVVWTIPLSDPISVSALYCCLVRGQESQLISIRSWGCRDGQVSAVVEPEAPLEDIVAILWSTGRAPVGIWLEDGRCTDSRPCN